MNKHLMFASVAVIAALASCSNNDTVEEPKGQAIGFKSMIDKNQSRANTPVLETANLNKFYVWGYANKDLNFSKQPVDKTGENVWTYTPEQYWEVGKSYAFVAVGSSAGADCTADFSVPAKGRPDDITKTFGSFTFDNQSAKGAEDVCYATENVATVTEINATMQKVNLAFNHALARVKFTFVNELTSAYKLSVSNIKIENAASNGTFDIAQAKWTTKTGTFELGFDDIAAMDMDAKDATDYQYILTGAENLTIAFDLTVEVNGNQTTYNHAGVAISLADNAEYENGHSYNFTARINATNVDPKNELLPIIFAPSVEPWTSPDTENDVDVKPAGE